MPIFFIILKILNELSQTQRKTLPDLDIILDEALKLKQKLLEDELWTRIREILDAIPRFRPVEIVCYGLGCLQDESHHYTCMWFLF